MRVLLLTAAQSHPRQHFEGLVATYIYKLHEFRQDRERAMDEDRMDATPSAEQKKRCVCVCVCVCVCDVWSSIDLRCHLHGL